MFRFGEKVVCVDAVDDLITGYIYTVTNVAPFLGVVLVSVDQSRKDAFYPRRFRPIVERKTDISIFTKMLKTEYVS